VLAVVDYHVLEHLIAVQQLPIPTQVRLQSSQLLVDSLDLFNELLVISDDSLNQGLLC
jgi:hypothetical protein